MSEKPDGGPAFPLQDWDEHIHASRRDTGMSLRDYFAAKAMQTYLDKAIEHSTHAHCCDITAMSYEMADAMLDGRRVT